MEAQRRPNDVVSVICGLTLALESSQPDPGLTLAWKLGV